MIIVVWRVALRLALVDLSWSCVVLSFCRCCPSQICRRVHDHIISPTVDLDKHVLVHIQNEWNPTGEKKSTYLSIGGLSLVIIQGTATVPKNTVPFFFIIAGSRKLSFFLKLFQTGAAGMVRELRAITIFLKIVCLQKNVFFQILYSVLHHD